MSTPPLPPNRMPTGIPGFDDLAGGGLPRGRTTLVVGGSGCGKTIFALQTVVEGARRWGEPAIFVAFEERTREILADAACFGWDIPQLQRKKLFFLNAHLESSTVLDGAFDLGGLLGGLSAKAQEMGARRIVFDGVDMLLARLDDPAAERAELHRLHQWLHESGLSGILTAKTKRSDPSLSPRYEFLQYLADCVILVQHRVTSTIASRHLQILKYRGGAASCNEFPMVLSKSGVEVAAYAHETLDYKVSTERVSSGVPHLDSMLHSGYFRGSSVLISGAPGTAKSTLAGAFAEAACRRGERALYVSFDEGSAQIVRNLRSVGIRLDPHVRSGRLEMYSAQAGSHNCEEHLLKVRSRLVAHGARALVVDPLSALVSTAGEGEARSSLERLIMLAKSRGVTIVATSLLEGADGLSDSTAVDLDTIADTWIHLSYVIQGGERNRALTIVKARGTGHSNQVRELVLTDGGVSLANVYAAGGTVLMGTLRWEREEQERAARARERREAEDRQRVTEESIADLKNRMETLKRELGGKVRELKRFTREQADAVETGVTRVGTIRGMRDVKAPAQGGGPARRPEGRKRRA